MCKRTVLLAALIVATGFQTARAATEAVGMSRESAALLAQAAKSEQLGPHLKSFGALRQLAFSGDFRAALAAAQKGAQAAANQPVTEAEMRARDLVAALFMGYQGELTALAGDVAEGKAILMKAERLDLPGDVKAMARSAQGYADMVVLDVSSAVANERRAASYARSYVQPVIESARALFEGSADAAYRALRPLCDQGASAGHATLYAACAALSLGRLDEAAQLLDKAKPSTGYLPVWFAAAGLLSAANGDLQQATGYFAEGARREFGRMQRCHFLSEVAALASGSNRRVALSALAAVTPVNYQRLGQDLEAAPSAAAARRALTTPNLWWTYSAYSSGALAAGQPKDAVDPKTGLNAGDGLPEPTVPPPGEGRVTEDGEAAKTTGGAGGSLGAETPAAAGAPGGKGGSGDQQESEIPEELRGVGITTYSTQAVAAFTSGVAHLRAGRSKEAWAALITSVKLWPGLAEGWLALGGMLQARGDARSLRDAVNAYGHAASLRTEWPEPYYGLGTAWEALGQRGIAAQHFQRALSNGLSGDAAGYAKSRLR